MSRTNLGGILAGLVLVILMAPFSGAAPQDPEIPVEVPNVPEPPQDPGIVPMANGLVEKGKGEAESQAGNAQREAERKAQEAQEQATSVQEQVTVAAAESKQQGEQAAAASQSDLDILIGNLRTFGRVTLESIKGVVGDALAQPGFDSAPDRQGSQSGRLATASLGVIVSPQSVGLILVVAAGAAGAAFLWMALLQRAVMFGLVPLLSRIAHSDIYNNDARRLIGDLVSHTAGLSLNEIVGKTGYSRNAVAYHLFVLEKEDELVSVKDGKYRRYFTRNGKYVNGAKNVVSALRNPTTLRIAQHITTNPGSIQRELCGVLGTTASAVCWHIKRLEEMQLVRKERVANTVHYYPGEAVGKYDLADFGLRPTSSVGLAMAPLAAA